MPPGALHQNAADFGTRSHSAIDRIIAGQPQPLSQVDADVRPVVEAFNAFLASENLALSPRGDTLVFSSKYGYAGACDAIGWRPDGSLVALDWKTSNAVYHAHGLQVRQPLPQPQPQPRPLPYPFLEASSSIAVYHG